LFSPDAVDDTIDRDDTVGRLRRSRERLSGSGDSVRLLGERGEFDEL